MRIKQDIYRITAIIFTIMFMISIYVLFDGFHGAYHSVGIIGICLLFASLIIKKETLAIIALIGLIVFKIAGVYTAIMFSNNFTDWTITMVFGLIFYVLLLLLEIVKYHKNKGIISD